MLEVPADSETVFNTLANFERYVSDTSSTFMVSDIFNFSYEKLIPTVRSAKINRLSDTKVKAQYSLSRFRLQANIIQTVIPEQVSNTRDFVSLLSKTIVSLILEYYKVFFG